jgi:putative redox protein
MAKERINVEWIENMAFKTVVNGHEFVIDAVEKVGGEDRGPRPKPLMMASLAGCTGMDVVSILKKMRVELDYFNVVVEAELTEEHPKHFIKMHVIYEFKGNDLPMAKLEKAIDLSEERYCGVSATYKQTMELTSEIKILN